MAKRSRDYYRHHRERVIKNKLKFIKRGNWNVTPGKEGSLSKGKVHCSCNMCSNKVKNNGFKAKTDGNRLRSMKEDIEEYQKE